MIAVLAIRPAQFPSPSRAALSRAARARVLEAAVLLKKMRGENSAAVRLRVLNRPNGQPFLAETRRPPSSRKSARPPAAALISLSHVRTAAAGFASEKI